MYSRGVISTPPSALGHSILYRIVKRSTCCQVDPLSCFEANEPFLDEKRIELARQYITKLCLNPSNPAYDCVVNLIFSDHYDKKPTSIPTLGLRMKPHIASAGLNGDISLSSGSQTRPLDLS